MSFRSGIYFWSLADISVTPLKKILFLAFSLSLTGCSLQRHYFVAQQPVRVFAEDYLSSRRLQDIPPGDTLSILDKSTVGSLYLIPVEYKGYRMYAYAPQLDFISTRWFRGGSRRNTNRLPTYVEQQTLSQPRSYSSYKGGFFVSEYRSGSGSR